MKSVYLGSELFFKQVLLKMMERCLLFLILFFSRLLFIFLVLRSRWLRKCSTSSARAENSAIKQHLIIKHNNSTDQRTSSDVWKIPPDYTIIIYKNNNEQLLIQETIYKKTFSKKHK